MDIPNKEWKYNNFKERNSSYTFNDISKDSYKYDLYEELNHIPPIYNFYRSDFNE